jgi:hypothetical protein
VAKVVRCTEGSLVGTVFRGRKPVWVSLPVKPSFPLSVSGRFATMIQQTNNEVTSTAVDVKER